MKSKPKGPTKTTEAVVTSTARLTIQGQTFEMPLAELEDLYGKIGVALGKKQSDDAADQIRKLRDALKKQNDRPHYIPPAPPILIPDPMRPEPWRMPEVWCLSSETVPHGENVCSIQLGKHSDQRDRF